MRITVVTHTTPNVANKDGLTVILFHLLEGLKQEHVVTVLALDQFENTQAVVEAVNAKLDTTDVLYLHGPKPCELLTHFPRLENIVCGYIDAESNKYAQLLAEEHNLLRKLKLRKQHRAAEQFERTVLSKARSIIMSTEVDANSLRHNTGSGPFIHVVPNGVDSVYFAPSDAQNNSVEKEHAIIFGGVLDQPTHVQSVLRFYKQVWPQIKASTNLAVKWYIVGKNPAKAIERLAQKDPNIIVTGFVPEMREFLLRCKVFISPLRVQSGFRNTVLEAMSCGLPVVAYAEACQGLETSPIFKVHSDNDFATTVTTWLSEPDKAKLVADRSRQYIKHNHQWPKHSLRYEHIFREASST